MNDGGIQYWQQFGQYQQEHDMGRYAKDSGGDFEQAPIGNHVARCFRIIDLGTQHGEYQGQPTTQSQIVISWELCQELMTNDEPFIISAFYTNSLSERAKLRPLLESWRGRAFTKEELDGFDLQKIVGTPCMLSIIHNDAKKARVASVAAMPKGMKAPPLKNPQFIFWMDEFDQETFEAIPEGIRNIVMRSDEYKALKNGSTEMDARNAAMKGIQDMDDSVPF